MAQFNVTVRKQKERSGDKWVVNIYRPGKPRKRRFFATEAEADAEAQAQRNEFEEAGLIALGLSPRQRLEASDAFLRLAPLRVSLSSVVDFYLAHKEPSRVTMRQFIDQFLENRRKVKRSDGYLSNLKNILYRLLSEDPNRDLSAYTTEYLDNWLHSQGLEAGGFNTYRAYLSSLFKWGETFAKYISKNPVASIPVMELKRDKVCIFTPDEMRRLLAAASTPGNEDVLLALAIGGYAGLRPESEFERLTWESIDFTPFAEGNCLGLIDVSAENKTAQQRYVKILPALAAVLATVSRGTGLIVRSNFRNRFDAVEKSSGVQWGHDILRHSYASYHLAYFEDAAALALQMGHSDTSMIFSNYRQRVKKSEAEKWWGI